MILPYSKGFNLVRTNQSNMAKAARKQGNCMLTLYIRSIMST